MKYGSRVAKRTMAFVLSAVLALVAVFAFSYVQTAQAITGETPEEKWTNFKTAVEAGGTVTLDEDLVAFSSITVGQEVTIEGTGTIRRDGANADFPVFTVSNGGNLTLGGNVVLSGQKVSCESTAGTPAKLSLIMESLQDVDYSGKKVVIYAGGSSGDHAALRPLAPVEDTTSNMIEWLSGTDVPLRDWYEHSKAREADESELSDAENAALKRAVWTLSKNGSGYTLTNDETNKILYLDADGTTGDRNVRAATAVNIPEGRSSEFNANRNPGGGPAGVDLFDTYFVYSGEYFNLWADQASRVMHGNTGTTGKNTSANLPKRPYIYVYTPAVEPSQGCDTGCDTYTSSDFASGSTDSARGFFVQVDGGKATLAGATLRDFVADGSVHHAAPVAVNGGRFDVTSGAITHNSVGYTADNSYWNAPAYSGGTAIGKEDETGTGSYNGAMGGWAKTETAGGIIYNAGSEGEISGGEISGNRGDTGGVLVQGQGNNENDVNQTQNGDATTSKLKFVGGAIDNNIGVHHGGGVSVYNGAAVQMGTKDNPGTAKISNNFAWHKGGGVFVSEEVFASMKAVDYYGEPARLEAGQAAFTLWGGSIEDNTAVLRGGGINVTSNHVSLEGGTIKGNNARVLGGGVYVEGDAGRMYQLYVANGCISGNSALTVAQEGAVTRGPSNTADGCAFDNALAVPGEGVDVTYIDGFWGEQGDGGGLWLCPLGGNATFAISETNTVVIAGNSASSNGKDVFVTAPRSGIGNGVNVISLGGGNDFVIEGTTNTLAPNTTYAGQLALANQNQTCDGGVLIQGNSAPNGGGIGADGTVIFGEAQDTYRASAGLNLAKTWGSDRSQDPITLKLFVESNGKRAALGEIELDGEKDNTGQESEDFNPNTALYESDPWVASIGLPLAVSMDDGSTVPLFTTSLGDPSNLGVLKQIYENGGQVELADWNLVIEETDAAGKTLTYVLPSGKATLDAVSAEAENGGAVTYTDIDGNELATAGTYSVNFAFSQDIANDNEPTIEKYVNKDVHKDIVINEEYPYDILVYVPLNAEELKITDSLNAKLQYVSTKEDIEKSAVVKATNDHKVNGTVAATDGTEVAAKATISGQDLTVEFADVTAAQGKYIQISFTAKVKDGLIYDDIKDSDKETITNNGTVLEGAAEHTGIPNDAKYSFKVDNEWSSDYDSNTVTVEPKPEEPEIEKYVNKNVHSEIQLDETFTYDIVAYVTKDADSVTITDKLDAQLQFVSKEADIPTVSLGETVDHTPNGSVAEDGSPVSNAVAKISGDTLTVTIADAKALRGQWVKVSFDAKIKDGLAVEDLNYTPIDKNEPVITDEKHKGVPNDASYTIKVGNKADFYSDNSNTVTVKPEEPQIEKYVAKDVHKEITVDEVFPYDVIVYVPTDADTIQIRDVLNDQLTFVDEAGAIAETAVVKDTNDHTVNGTVANSDGTPIAATASIEGQTLTVDIADATAARGKYIQITFNARLADGVDISALEMDTITDNGDVLGGLDSHTGVPNTAEYRIGIKNGSDVDWSKYAPEGDEDGWNKSNTVTVKPDDSKREIVISKVDGISGNELPGAALKVSDADGNEVASWASTSAAKRTSLQPGTYTLEETSAPTGYTAITSPITFSIAEDGTVTCSEDGDGAVTVTGRNRVVVTNTAQVNLSAEASKVSKHWDDGGNDALRKNVVFDLYFSSDKQTWYPANKSIELSASDAVEVEGMDTWATSFNNLPAVVDGKQAYYVAVERTDFTGQYVSGVNIEQLSGGAISISDGEEEVIEIISTVGGDGMDATNHPFTPNTSVEISKQQVGGGPELPGAKLTVYRIDEQGNRIEIETWTSGDAPHMLSGLEPGIYVLKEVTAPNGYEVAEEMTFRVNVDGTVEVLQNGQWFSAEDHIVMFDAPTTEPGKPGTPTQDKTAKPTKGTPAKTADAAGKTTLALLLAALLSVGGFAYAGSRTRTSRKK